MTWMRLDLKGTTLKVAVNHYPPICSLVRMGGTNSSQTLLTTRYSVEIELLRVFEEVFNFSAQLVDAKQDWGLMQPDGKWGGAIGLAANQTVNFSLCGITRTYARSQSVDFTHFVTLDEMSFLTQCPERLSSAWIIGKPFSTPVWFLCLFAYLAVLCSLYYVLHLVICEHDEMDYHSRRFYFVATRLYAILVRQSFSMAAKSPFQVRLIYATWMLSVVVIGTSYCASFYAFLSIATYKEPINTLEDLIYAITVDQYRITTFDQSSYLARFIHSTPEEGYFYTIGKHINQSGEPMLKNGGDLGIMAVESDPKRIYLNSRFSLVYNRKAYAKQPLHIGKEGLELDYMALAFPKGSTLLTHFNWLIINLYETGFLTYWARQTVLQANLDHSEHRDVISHHEENTFRSAQSTIEVLHLQHLQSIYLVWGLGLVTAGLILLGEISIKYSQGQ